MNLMNRIFKLYVDQSVTIFIDEILIYSKSNEVHISDLKIVLEVLRQNQLFTKFFKCEF